MGMRLKNPVTEEKLRTALDAALAEVPQEERREALMFMIGWVFSVTMSDWGLTDEVTRARVTNDVQTDMIRILTKVSRKKRSH